MLSKVVVCFVLLGIISQTLCDGVNADNQFSVEPEDIQLKEISENVRRVTGAVMGLTEYVMDIRQELHTIRSDIAESKGVVGISNATKIRPDAYFSRPARDPVEVRRQSLELADKVEKLLAMDQSPEVDLAKEELKRTVEKNFLRMLAAILITGPAHTQERADDIFKLMRSVLNGELDFTPVVQRLPLILRDSETNQFVNLLITLRESEKDSEQRESQGLLSSIDTLAQVANNRQILSNFPNSAQQIFNPVQSSPQLLSSYPNNNNYPNPNFQNNNLIPSSQAVVSTSQNGQQVISNNQQQLQQQQQQQQQLNQNLSPNYNPNLNNLNNLNSLNNLNNLNNINTQQQNPNVPVPGDTRNQLPSINSILDGLTQTNQLIKEIPTLVEGLQTLVESIEGIFG